MGDGETCAYCDAPLPTRYELDHFPIPARLGGRSTLPACMNCHDLKDRTPLEEWPLDAMRLFLAVPMRAIAIALEVVAGHRRCLATDLFDLLDEWESVPPHARTILAKITRMVVAVALGEAVPGMDRNVRNALPNPLALLASARDGIPIHAEWVGSVGESPTIGAMPFRYVNAPSSILGVWAHTGSPRRCRPTKPARS